MSVRAKSLILTLAGAAMLAGLPLAFPTGWLTRAAAAGFPVATDSRIGGDENQTRFVVDLSAKVDLRAFTLGRSLPCGRRPAAGHLPAQAESR